MNNILNLVFLAVLSGCGSAADVSEPVDENAAAKAKLEAAQEEAAAKLDGEGTAAGIEVPEDYDPKSREGGLELAEKNLEISRGVRKLSLQDRIQLAPPPQTNVDYVKTVERYKKAERKRVEKKIEEAGPVGGGKRRGRKVKAPGEAPPM